MLVIVEKAWVRILKYFNINTSRGTYWGDAIGRERLKNIFSRRLNTNNFITSVQLRLTEYRERIKHLGQTCSSLVSPLMRRACGLWHVGNTNITFCKLVINEFYQWNLCCKFVIRRASWDAWQCITTTVAFTTGALTTPLQWNAALGWRGLLKIGPTRKQGIGECAICSGRISSPKWLRMQEKNGLVRSVGMAGYISGK